jgi:hypothetical protein
MTDDQDHARKVHQAHHRDRALNRSQAPGK